MENDNYNKIFYIGPESYALMDDSEVYSSGNYDSLIPTYFNVSVAKSIDIQVRVDNDNQIEDSFIYAALDTRDFVKNTGWRVGKFNLSMGDVTSKRSIREFVNVRYY